MDVSGLDLFNDDTRPSGHISCPNVSGSHFELYSAMLVYSYAPLHVGV